MQQATEVDSQLIDELSELRGSRTSELFDRKAIRILGAELVRQALGEVRTRVLTRNPAAEPVEDPSKYLTRTLVNWMKERGLYESPEPVESRDLPASPFSLIEAARPVSTIIQNDPITTLDCPFSPDLIQWLVFVGPEYFTLTNEKAKSDRVAETTIFWKGRSYKVPMLRGRLGRNDSERGILTAEHIRIMAAVEAIWAKQVGPHEKFSRRCVVKTSVPEIAHYLGITPGGREYNRIKRQINDLRSTGYTYLLDENPELKAMGLVDINFTFFAEAEALTNNINGKKTTYFQIAFSRAFSAALLSRGKHIVSRPLDTLTIRGDIALKMYVYLYPILTAYGKHQIELKNLIKALDLRLAGWQQYKSQRKREFAKAIREINGRQTHDKQSFDLRIEDMLEGNDFILMARLAK